eukprot:1138161-Pelagomonas_calceolata.AAC.6
MLFALPVGVGLDCATCGAAAHASRGSSASATALLLPAGAADSCIKGLYADACATADPAADAGAVVPGFFLDPSDPLVAFARLGRLNRSSPKLLGTTGPWNCCQWGPAVWEGQAGGGDA